MKRRAPMWVIGRCVLAWCFLGTLVVPGGDLARGEEEPPQQQKSDSAAATVVVDVTLEAERKERRQSSERAIQYQAAFATASKLSVEERLRAAVRTTDNLYARSAVASVPEDVLFGRNFIVGKTSGRFPRRSHLTEFVSCRPWWYVYGFAMYSYPDGIACGVYRETDGYKWPTSLRVATLRDLLRSSDSKIRALAVEALGTLEDPDDVERFFALLNDNAAAPATLIRNDRFGRTNDDDPIEFDQIWEAQRVCDYARRALGHMTGITSNIERHPAFASNHQGSREHLWYWQQRFQHELTKVNYFPLGPSHVFSRTDDDRNVRKAKVAERRAELQAELAKMSPEVEAKARLLATPRYEWEGFFEVPLILRISADRGFDLLAKKNLWPDVDWADGNGQMHRTLKRRVFLSAELLFKPEDAPRLKALFSKELDKKYGYAGSAIYLGISRLLPPAKPQQLDDPETRDGWLRLGALQEKDTFSRADLCAELVRVGLPNNAPFITERFFGAVENSAFRNLQDRILQEAGRAPLTGAKRDFLVAVVLDPRFEPMLPLHDGWYWYAAAMAINDHAQRQIFDTKNRERSPNPGMGEIRKRVIEWMEEQKKAP